MLILLVYRMFVWGWFVLGLVGACSLISLLWGKRLKIIRIVAGILAIVLAASWESSVRTFTWGIKYQAIQTQSGDMVAEAWNRDATSHYLKIRRQDGRKVSLCLPIRSRGRLFWIEEGKTIGVAAGKTHLIVCADLLLDPTITQRRRNLSPEEEVKLDYNKPLSPEREKLFEAAERASREQ